MNLPEKFCEKMKALLGGEYDAFIKAFDSSDTRGILINETKSGSKQAVLNEFGSLKEVPWCSSGFYVDKEKIRGTHPYHMAGLFYFQEPSAMCAAAGLPIVSGDKVLDLCAAPGGKTAQAAARLCGNGVLVSNEIIKSRAAILSENVERLGLTNVIVTNETPQRLAKKYTGFFDKIIVDAPCSGEGMFRKNPNAAEEWSPEHVLSCAERQKKILECAAAMLKTGGLLMYSTCTFAPEENEMIAAHMVQNGFEICDIPELSMLSPGRTQWSGTNIDMTKTRRIFPHIENGEGHFAALFKKTAESQSTGVKVSEKQNKRTDKKSASDLQAALKLFEEFEDKYLTTSIVGHFLLFGDNLYCCPEGIDIDNIKVMRCGLHVGTIKKNRFEPSHSLALALRKSDFKLSLDFSCSDRTLLNYLCGHTISTDKTGWTAICVNGFPIGWGKGSQGALKNHYPKKLRLNESQLNF